MAVRTIYKYRYGHELNLVRQPCMFDVMVTENLPGDIPADLATGLIGGMGLAPPADIGDRHAMFRPCCGSARDRGYRQG